MSDANLPASPSSHLRLRISATSGTFRLRSLRIASPRLACLASPPRRERSGFPAFASPRLASPPQRERSGLPALASPRLASPLQRECSGLLTLASPHLRSTPPPVSHRLLVHAHLRFSGNAPDSSLSHLRISGARPRLPATACSSTPLDDRSDTCGLAWMRSLVPTRLHVLHHTNTVTSRSMLLCPSCMLLLHYVFEKHATVTYKRREPNPWAAADI